MLETKKHINTLQAAQNFLSESTQWIQMSYEKRPFLRADSAPFYHNFIYAYILLNTKQRPEMEQGIQKLEHLMCFQVNALDFKVNFPRYLHQYPHCDRSFEILDICVPICKILQHFGHILPKELRSRIHQLVTDVMSSLIIWLDTHSAPYLLKIQMYALLIALGTLLKEAIWVEKGRFGLEQLFALGPHKTWGSVRHLSKMILFLGLIEGEAQPFYLQSFWNYLIQSWHSKLLAYQGASLNEHFYQNQPENTLYHLFMSDQFDLPRPALADADLMEAELLPTIKQVFDFQPTEHVQYTLNPFSVTQYSKDNYSISFFQMEKDQWEKRGGFYPLKIIMQGDATPDHFALEMGSFCTIRPLTCKQFELIFEPEHELDVSFFINLASNVQVTLNGQKATMFNLEHPIDFIFKNFKISLTQPESQKGIWAQLLHNNRRSQLIKEFNHTYDAQLYLRNIQHASRQPLVLILTLTSIPASIE